MSKLESMLASRFLKARKHNRLLSFLSVTSIIGVMLGVATLIIVVSVMDGFVDNLKSKFLGANPHIIISGIQKYGVDDWEKYIPYIEKADNVKGAAPLIMGQAMISSGNEISGVIIRGIDPGVEMNISSINGIMVRGSLEALESNGGLPSILLGQEIMFAVGAVVGSEITLISPVLSRSAFGFVPKMKKFRVAGFFDTGIYEHNKSLAYININDARDFFMTSDGAVSAITVYTKNADKATETASLIQKYINESGYERLWARDWLSMNGALFAAMKLEQFAMFVILTLIIIVASFNIVSMISVTVKDKRKEIAILRAVGASQSLIKRVFVRQGLIIGMIGTFLGNILALIIGLILKNFEIIKIPKEIYHSSTIPITLSPFVFIFVTVCAVIIIYIASVIPAGISAKADPIEAIRND